MQAQKYKILVNQRKKEQKDSCQSKRMIALTPRQAPPTAVFKTQTLKTRQAKSRRDDPTPPQYAMSGFDIEMDEACMPQPKMPANAQASVGMTWLLRISHCLTLKKVDTIVNKNGENQKETEEIQSRRKNGDGEASLSRRHKSK